MLCEICQQREATIHTKQIVNGQHSEQHLCTECAAKKDHEVFQKFAEPFSNDFFGDTGFSHWFQPMFQGNVSPQIKKQQDILPCPHCGTSWELFQKQGLLGCQTCYDHFADGLPNMLRRLHGKTEHIGKSPRQATPPTEKEVLHQSLQKAIKEEAFEEAVRLRDALKALEVKEKKPERGESDATS